MTCHSGVSSAWALTPDRRLALIGHPNVGKSVFFQRLTGQRVTVSNFPGTTVETSRGCLGGRPNWELLDTPGVVTLPAHAEDEAVTERILLAEALDGVIQVGDAKNPRRTLALTIQLIELGIPLVVAFNMHDEAQARGIRLDAQALGRELGVPVFLTTAIQGAGVQEVVEALSQVTPPVPHIVSYPEPVEQALAELMPLLPQGTLHPRGLALLWLLHDPVLETWLQDQLASEVFQALQTKRAAWVQAWPEDPARLIHRARGQVIDGWLQTSLQRHELAKRRPAAWLTDLTTHPLWGSLLLAVVLTALYWFVGVFGAGTMVDFLESTVFGTWINPVVQAGVERFIPWPWLVDALVGECGLWTMGITYAFALILPIVTTFFLAFSVLEDSGYLPRLAALSNRFFTVLGLNGKAVLPMVLGLGCVTMATLTTRILESRRERLLTVLLLALAIPCSAQLGVVMGMLGSVSGTALLIWTGVVVLVLLSVGWLAARLLPGTRTPLLVELPPLRWPQAANILVKTLARLEWYLKEVVPLFLLGAFLMFLLDRLHLLDALIRLGEPLVQGWLGLPPEASAAFVMGFLRRDFGATGLFIMGQQGILSPEQTVVAMVTITLFVPCIASVLMIAREYGHRVALSVLFVVFPLALGIGGLLHRLLLWLSWGV